MEDRKQKQTVMGHLKPFIIIGRTPPGTCPECATKHDPELPHNQQSLTYQYKFYDQHGRWPTWGDAMAHCSEETKALWKVALWKVELEKLGIKS